MRKFPALFLLLFILAGVPAIAQTKSKKTNSTAVVSTAARFGNTHGIMERPVDQFRGNEKKVVRTIFATAWELSNRPARPKVDKPLKLDGN